MVTQDTPLFILSSNQWVGLSFLLQSTYKKSSLQDQNCVERPPDWCLEASFWPWVFFHCPTSFCQTTLPVLSYSLKYSLIACHTGSSGDTHCNLHWLRLPTIWKAHLVKCRTVIQNGKPQTRVAFLHNCQMQRACATETQEETQVSIRK